VIEELDGGKSKKVLLATVLAAARRHELPVFTVILTAALTRPTETISSS
jgi:hypothetical protein